jgi:HK97 family phage prohead protease
MADTRLLSIEEFRAQAKVGAGAKAAVFRPQVGTFKAFDPARRSYRFCFSDSGEDRMTDTIDAKGWQLDNFLRAPTALFAHDSNAPPIGRAANVAVEGERLMGDIEFAPPEVYEFADTIYKLVGGRFLNAVSVGFLPVEHQWSNDPEREWGIDFIAQELLEISVVPVPANPRALIDARAKGIDTRPLVEWAEKMLDGRVAVERAELDRLRQLAAEPRRRRPAAQPNGGNRVADPVDDKVLRAAVRAEFRRLRLRGGTPKRRDSQDGDPKPGDLPEGHEKAMRTAAMHFKSAADYYDGADEHHAAAADLMEKAISNLDSETPPDDHEDCVRSAQAHFKSADALDDLGDDHHDKGMKALELAVKALDDEPASAPPDDPAKAAIIAAALAKVASGRQKTA